MAVQNNTFRVAYRVAGSSDPWQVLRITEDTLTTASTTVESDEVRTDRQSDDSSTTSIDPEGSVSFHFTADTFDDMIEAAMHSTFTAGEVIIGTQQIKFDLLKSDTQTDRHFLFENMSVSEANIELAEGALITGQFSFVGETVDLAYDPTGDTFLDTTETKVINCNKNIDNATLLFDGTGASSQGLYLNSLSININNSYEAAKAIGHVGAVEQSAGEAVVTGSVEFHAASAAYDLWASQIDDTDHTVSFTFGSGKVGESDYTVSLPRVRFQEGDLPGASKSGTATMSFNLKGLRDPSSNTNLKITKVDDVI